MPHLPREILPASPHQANAVGVELHIVRQYRQVVTRRVSHYEPIERVAVVQRHRLNGHNVFHLQRQQHDLLSFQPFEQIGGRNGQVRLGNASLDRDFPNTDQTQTPLSLGVSHEADSGFAQLGRSLQRPNQALGVDKDTVHTYSRKFSGVSLKSSAIQMRPSNMPSNAGAWRTDSRAVCSIRSTRSVTGSSTRISTGSSGTNTLPSIWALSVSTMLILSADARRGEARTFKRSCRATIRAMPLATTSCKSEEAHESLFGKLTEGESWHVSMPTIHDCFLFLPTSGWRMR